MQKSASTKTSPSDERSVSVVIPVRNGAETLGECLASVFSQTEQPLEVIVVDNGSTDGTPDVIRDFARKHPTLRRVREERIGRGSARNAGVAAARGGIVAMTDADCIVPNDWIPRIAEPIRKENENAAMGFEKAAGGGYWARMRQEEDERFLASKVSGNYADHVDTKNFAVRADVMKNLLFDPEFPAYEDWDLFLRLKKRGVKIRFLPDLIVRHRHDSSLTELVRTQYARARGMERIFVAHFNDPVIRGYFNKDASARSHRLWNFFAFAPWAVWQFVKNPKRAPFRVAADAAWKTGLIAESLALRLMHCKIGIFRRRLGIQMEMPELFAVSQAIRPPMNFLIFGLGNDSAFWHRMNRGGRTVFLEDELDWWIDPTRKKHPDFEVHRVEYGTRAGEWRELIGHPEKLGLELPPEIRETAWDIVLVDAPAGYAPDRPGRMKSIFEAARLAKPGGSVFIHDSEREIEKEYGERYLGKESIAGEVTGRALMRRYFRTV